MEHEQFYSNIDSNPDLKLPRRTSMPFVGELVCRKLKILFVIFVMCMQFISSCVFG